MPVKQGFRCRTGRIRESDGVEVAVSRIFEAYPEGKLP